MTNKSFYNPALHYHVKIFLMVSAYILIVLTNMLTNTVHANQADNNSLLIRNARIVSGDNPTASATRDVLIQGNTIIAVGENLQHQGKVIDATSKYLIPGLIDTHVHLGGIPGYKDDGSMNKELVENTLQQIPRNYLYFGFTTLLDLTGSAEFIDQWNSNELAPQALRCAPVTIPNGYPMAWLDKHEQFLVPHAKYMLFDSSQKQLYPTNFNAVQHSPKAIANRVKTDGATCIKVFYETGFGPKKGLPVPAVELVQSLVKYAHELGLPVYLHGNSQVSYEFALATGVDTVVHGMWHWGSFQNASQDKLKIFAKKFSNKDIAIQPTIQVIHGEQELFNNAYFDDERVINTMPADLIKWFKSEQGQWMTEIMAAQFLFSSKNKKELYSKVKTTYKTPIEQVNLMSHLLAENGTTLLFGSDTPSGPFYTQFPGINGRFEMDRWLDAGLSLHQLFAGLTINNAKNLGMQNTIGQIKQGFRANLLLLDLNPLKTINAYDSINWIIMNGKFIERQSLAVSHAE
ncbi:amidohydrolase family protein [Paraglaciecola aquimarina]|uniref:Amidohydrolase family protein n=1 Tax=Paraglaciecola algarum TaxID=3050085 RepID=A0ABS9D3F6_9ALTE|nr:amidohydrolase family protein [Paraglaciecola sp. G1-23]MCF2947164.1 amidohydrolase family protein [Paraglaciecola sp. G1-23]